MLMVASASISFKTGGVQLMMYLPFLLRFSHFYMILTQTRQLIVKQHSCIGKTAVNMKKGFKPLYKKVGRMMKMNLTLMQTRKNNPLPQIRTADPCIKIGSPSIVLFTNSQKKSPQQMK